VFDAEGTEETGGGGGTEQEGEEKEEEAQEGMVEEMTYIKIIVSFAGVIIAAWMAYSSYLQGLYIRSTATLVVSLLALWLLVEEVKAALFRAQSP
jgi:uncharacterized membrane protein